MSGFRSPQGETDWVSVGVAVLLVLIIVLAATGVVHV
jgi:hypothetical protein